MTAQEARQITKTYTINVILNGVYKQIKERAENGFSTLDCSELNPAVVLQLQASGFTVTQSESKNEISWSN